VLVVLEEAFNAAKLQADPVVFSHGLDLRLAWHLGFGYADLLHLQRFKFWEFSHMITSVVAGSF
jgi:hypothetical protein